MKRFSFDAGEVVLRLFSATERSGTGRRFMAVMAGYVEICKPRISAMVLLTVVAGGYLTAGADASISGLIHSAIGVLLLSASGSTWNQYLERYTDFLMPRTARRPLPTHRLTAQQVAIFGAVTLGAGLAYLAAVVNWAAMILGLATWGLYVAVYTPLKVRTWWNTAVGAVAGALPVLIGAVGTGQPISGVSWGLFVILFLWQFPHFMAIAWLYRQDYADAGLQMLTVVDPTGRRAGRQAVFMALTLLVFSVGVGLMFDTISIRIAVSVICGMLGIWYAWASVAFLREPDDTSARRLLRVSLIHLPAVLLTLVVGQGIG
jgi:protoheme IX farnesyltransferase